MNNYRGVPQIGSKVKRVKITKCESEHHENTELECRIEFDDGTSVFTILERDWHDELNKHLYCEVDDDKYSRGIYELRPDGNYEQIEDWDN